MENEKDPKETGAAEEDEMVEVSQSDLKQVLESNKRLEQQLKDQAKDLEEYKKFGGHQIRIADEVQEHTCRIAFVDGNPIVDFENLSRNPEKRQHTYHAAHPHEKGEKVLRGKVVVLKDGERVTVDVNWNEFLQEVERREATIKERREAKDKSEHYGYMKKKEVKGDAYSMSETDVMVPIRVTEVEYEYVVDVDGEELVLPFYVINI